MAWKISTDRIIFKNAIVQIMCMKRQMLYSGKCYVSKKKKKMTLGMTRTPWSKIQVKSMSNNFHKTGVQVPALSLTSCVTCAALQPPFASIASSERGDFPRGVVGGVNDLILGQGLELCLAHDTHAPCRR